MAMAIEGDSLLPEPAAQRQAYLNARAYISSREFQALEQEGASEYQSQQIDPNLHERHVIGVIGAGAGAAVTIVLAAGAALFGQRYGISGELWTADGLTALVTAAALATTLPWRRGHKENQANPVMQNTQKQQLRRNILPFRK